MRECLTIKGAFVDREDDDWIVFDPATLGAVARIPARYANAEAVARKFAAADDLLEAGAVVLEVIDLLGEGKPVVLGKPTLDRLRAAVAKATTTP